MTLANQSFWITSLLTFGLSMLLLALTFWGYRTKVDIEKISVYECGFNPYSQPRANFDVKFYLVALIFIVFDIEVLFLFPIALEVNTLVGKELALFFWFIAGIFVGIFYEIAQKY